MQPTTLELEYEWFIHRLWVYLMFASDNDKGSTIMYVSRIAKCVVSLCVDLIPNFPIGGIIGCSLHM